ncbi:uncharacterized protein LACBIDRAFT_303927 [Laccaria bicolor S238N-H82]|uniref:Predicted protein n=1 Tax=Laccaria bicolor (strain S238N-H82 / ATCC MYA-4686) TaxID=486041 RepID=B0DJZ0_LACBS|nr:uncharacterized protein LACBIDRAFT_303927 [Laccaria bicolor S238N-H82]EDR05098.1 predicted protein [Laccaria bicolor S238N-H82]|eukprot:XP_001884488.1 predicted protein [Laccaria bicolor S238N-H82]
MQAENMQSEYSERATKHRKLELPEVLWFLDLEAQVSEVETDDQVGSDEGDLIDDDEDIDESNSGDAHQNLLREAMMPSDDDTFWESFLKCVMAHQHIAEEDIQDIGKASLWAVPVKPRYEERIVCRVHRRLMDPRFPARF